MAVQTHLMLRAPRGADGVIPPLPQIPAGTPAVVEDCGLALNHLHLLGEALGEDTSEALRSMDTTYTMLDDFPDTLPDGTPLPMLLIEEDYPVLIDACQRVLAALSGAIDGEGRPSGPSAERLLLSPHLFSKPDGTLHFKGFRERSIVSIRASLMEVLDMLRFAHLHGLLVEVVQT
ncbi:MAG: hypothetical protein QM820_57110 [Minicystis sp.]